MQTPRTRIAQHLPRFAVFPSLVRLLYTHTERRKVRQYASNVAFCLIGGHIFCSNFTRSWTQVGDPSLQHGGAVAGPGAVSSQPADRSNSLPACSRHRTTHLIRSAGGGRGDERGTPPRHGRGWRVYAFGAAPLPRSRSRRTLLRTLLPGSDLLISDGVVRGRGCKKSLEFPVFR